MSQKEFFFLFFKNKKLRPSYLVPRVHEGNLRSATRKYALGYSLLRCYFLVLIILFKAHVKWAYDTVNK